jgi:hypothetical protein
MPTLPNTLDLISPHVDTRARGIGQASLDVYEDLSHQVAALRNEVTALKLTVHALVDMLVARGKDGLGAAAEFELAQTVQARLANLVAAQTGAAVETTQCDQCGATVPRNKTNLTANGNVCDICFHL